MASPLDYRNQNIPTLGFNPEFRAFNFKREKFGGDGQLMATSDTTTTGNLTPK